MSKFPVQRLTVESLSLSPYSPFMRITGISLFSLIFCLAFCLASCTAKSPQALGPVTFMSGIVGGKEVSADDPRAGFVAMLYVPINEVTGGVCTATFIAEDTLLTAAHCLNGPKDKTSIYFMVNPYDQKATPVMLPVKDFIPHEEYKVLSSGVVYNDIGLIKFSGGLPPGAHIAKISNLVFDSSMGHAMTFLGYGIGDGTSASSGRLRLVEKTVTKAKNRENQLMMSHLDKTGTCRGDSGGPGFLFDKDGTATVSAVISYLIVYGDLTKLTDAEKCYQYSFLMDVSGYQKWIADHLN